MLYKLEFGNIEKLENSEGLKNLGMPSPTFEDYLYNAHYVMSILLRTVTRGISPRKLQLGVQC